MKSEVNPVIGVVVVVVLLGVVGFFLWRGTGGTATKPTGAVGNASPFAPGGAANSKGGKPAAAGRAGMPGGMPGGMPSGASGGAPRGQ